MARVRVLVHFLIPAFLLSSCTAQETKVDRPPAVAGAFYPAGKADLEKTVDALLASWRNVVPSRGLRALIVPHAGYVYSGEVAARGYMEIDGEAEWDNVFVLSPSHHVGFEGASVYTRGDYLTPLGPVAVNREIATAIVRRGVVFTDRVDAHEQEHAVEVQLPFLQRRLGKPFRIVPIVIGAGGAETYRRIADALRPYFTDRNLFVVSTDFSHYPSYEEACRLDRETVRAICSKKPDELIALVSRSERSPVPNLATRLCGWPAVLTLMEMTKGDENVAYDTLMYRNSGDTPAGDKSRVVGYWALAVRALSKGTGETFRLTEQERAALLTAARNALRTSIAGETVERMPEHAWTGATRTPCGAFVTLRKHGALRGCIGNFSAEAPLYRTVEQMAIAAATQDPRFQRVRPDELEDIDIEISVLTPLRRIRSIDEFVLGKHGIYIRKDGHSGTFLPQVAAETGWSVEEFLGHCARDKAGIGWDGWKDAELYVYEALVFGEKENAPGK
ncbi:MAG: AmmeMemoRadiSam system protein B [Bacteroidota bacterium]|nr:AmmeMemoRadiSam system protein B [Bacteroidota bacterium]